MYLRNLPVAAASKRIQTVLPTRINTTTSSPLTFRRWISQEEFQALLDLPEDLTHSRKSRKSPHTPSKPCKPGKPISIPTSPRPRPAAWKSQPHSLGGNLNGVVEDIPRPSPAPRQPYASGAPISKADRFKIPSTVSPAIGRELIKNKLRFEDYNLFSPNPGNRWKSRGFLTNLNIPANFFTNLVPLKLFPYCLNAPRYVLVPPPEEKKEKKPVQPAVPEFGAMRSHVQIVAAPTADTPGACLLVHYDNRRYLFGHVAEGTQRLFTENKLPAAKLSHIFLTGKTDWGSTGGLLGMVLTIADVIISAKAALAEENKLRRQKNRPDLEYGGPKRIEIHGSKNLEHMLAAARRFVFRKGFPLDAHEHRDDPRAANPENSKPDYEDENLKVWKIPIVATGVESRARSSSAESQNPRKRKLNPSEEAETMETVEEPQEGEAVDETPTGVENDEEKKRMLMQTVIKHMFDSDWSPDTLVEMPLKMVKMPAKIFVRDEENNIKNYTGPVPGRDPEVPNIRVLVREPWPGALVHKLPPTDPCFDSTCYIVKNHSRRGKFQPANAAKFDLPKWDYSKLTKGQSVTAPDGTVVTPDMVMDPPIPGHGFALLDVRYEYLLDGLLKRPEWENKEIMEHVDAFYWILSPEVKDDARLKDFMAKYSSYKHIVLGEGMNPNVISFGGASGKAIMMHRMDPDRFCIPNHDNSEKELPADLASVAELGKPGQRLLLSPSVEFQNEYATELMDTIKPIYELTSTHAKAFHLALAAQKKLADPAFAARVAKSEQDIPNRDAEIVTLGTGSALPSKYRNVSATLIRVPGYGSYLLDCGENTLGQLRRVYGYAETDAILRDLRVIYVSHLHADHHLGVPSILAQRARAFASSPSEEVKPITIISTAKYIGFLHEYKDVEPLDWSSIKFITLIGTGRKVTDSPDAVTGSADLGPSNNYFNYLPHTLCTLQPAPLRHQPELLEAQTGLAAIDACFVEHCLGATAAVFTWPSGLKISFSGDCRPSPAFAHIGKGSHLLIHECTFDDELVHEAKAKKHSTAGEALDVARKMEARRVLLTHFSQRYPKMQEASALDDEGQDDKKGDKKDRMVVLYAFDYMRVKLGEFKMAERFLPALRELYKELESEEGEEAEE
ncbi:hypothetical protein B0T20DRAFT_422259 [Sordaria brevicollis]|uniref:ribonuclease Z n=1 Tax=Sordaria brevicollis TaxID=83679 RepID=A0AAE0P1U3_SORBR|nr:hypothetical protein B0T20DRAFT_422259 [Sordaria brevicollis]